jgi:hypothetical protein
VVFAVKPVILLVKIPVPVPSVVLLLAVVGLTEVPQHTPLAVTEAPPSDVTFPPLVAVVDVVAIVVPVVTVGGTIPIDVVKVTSPPNEVPALLVA